MTAPTPPPTVELSVAEARNIAVAAALPASGFPTVAAALAHLHIVQLDSINTLARAHQLTLTARVPDTTTLDIDAALNDSTEPIAFDYPAHASASCPSPTGPCGPSAAERPAADPNTRGLASVMARGWTGRRSSPSCCL
ncbi:hypothetical protein [Streptomyces sp. NPDC056632]|uniref:hypothetical protein n=1 Tax=Streptomyces sp. NPDC056632 TaxID=3345884 RepID=UPI0036B98124